MVIEVTRNKNRVVFSFGNLFMLFCFRIAKNRIALTHSLAVISVSTVAATALLCYWSKVEVLVKTVTSYLLNETDAAVIWWQQIIHTVILLLLWGRT